jgi:hypothetical protein
MLTQLSVWARTARSQLETGCGPRQAASAGAVVVNAAIPTAAVAMAMIAPKRRLLLIHSSMADACPSVIRRGKTDTMGTGWLSSAFDPRFGRTYSFLYKMVSARSAEKMMLEDGRRGRRNEHRGRRYETP